MLICLLLGWLALALPLSLDGRKSALAGWRNRWWAPMLKLFPAVVPLAFLVFRGAGLNPFVSMPGAFGMVFFLLSLKGDLSEVSKTRILLFGSVVLAGCLTLVAGAREKMHPSPGMESRMRAYEEVVDAMLASSEKTGLDLTYSFVTLGNLHGSGVQNVLVFDRGAKIHQGVLTLGDLERKFVFFGNLPVSAPVEWAVDWTESREVKPQERMKELAALANSSISYMILPDDETARNYAETKAFNYVNQFSAQFRDLILEGGDWKVISGPAETWDGEVHYVYENQRLKPSN